MAFGKYPRGQMHCNVERIHLARFQIARFAHRLPLSPVDPGPSDLRDGSIGRHVDEFHREVRVFRIGGGTQHDFDIAPTPSHQLKLALILGTQGHPATDLPKAQTLLRELMANPEVLLPGERALAFLELSQIDDHLTLEAENRRLQTDAARADREHIAKANNRLQAELDENARLRKELDEARAKLAAIANIERSLNERKPGTTGH